MRGDFGRVAAAEGLKIALCSESSGNSVAPWRATAAHDRRAGADQRLLIGERDGPAALDRRVGRPEADRADDGGDDEIGRPARRRLHRLRAAGGLDAAAGKAGFQVGVAAWLGDGGEFGARARWRCGRAPRRRGRPTTASTEKRPGLSRITRAQDLPIEPVAPSRTRRFGAPAPRGMDVKSKSSPNSPFKQSRRDPRPLGSRPGDRRRERRRYDEAVEPIHQAPMAGNEAARILHPRAALHRRFEEIARLRHRRSHEPELQQRRGRRRREPSRPRTARQERPRRRRRRARRTRSCPARSPATASARRSVRPPK